MNLSQMQRNYGPEIIEILREVEVAHVGWDMDNKVWLVLLSDGTRVVLGTNHGGLYHVSEAQLANSLDDARSRFVELNNLSKEYLEYKEWIK